MNKVYGVDLDKKVTPVLARDAVIKCFLKAHSEVLEEMKEYTDFKSEAEFERMKKLNVELIIKNIFKDVKVDFNNPNKNDIIDVCDALAEFAKNFRKPEIVKKHYEQIMKIVKKLE